MSVTAIHVRMVEPVLTRSMAMTAVATMDILAQNVRQVCTKRMISRQVAWKRCWRKCVCCPNVSDVPRNVGYKCSLI